MTVCPNCGADVKGGGARLAALFGQCTNCNPSWIRLYENASEDVQIPDVRNPGERTIGAELELNISLDSATKIFDSKMIHFKHDGSLRMESPTELVTPILSSGTFASYIERLYSMLEITELYSRQSTHVHIGTSDFSWIDLNALAAKAAANEKFFTALCPPTRAPSREERNDGGPRALPLIPIFPDKETMLRYFYGRNDLRFKKHANQSIMKANKRCNDGDMRNGYPRGVLYRYNWLNIHGHFHKGALEWRIFSATKNKDKLINWITLLLQFTEAAKIMGAKEFVKTPMSHMFSPEIWYWALHRINSLRDYHLRFQTLSPGHYTGKKEMPILEAKIPSIRDVVIPPKEEKPNVRESTREIKLTMVRRAANDWEFAHFNGVEPEMIDQFFEHRERGRVDDPDIAPIFPDVDDDREAVPEAAPAAPEAVRPMNFWENVGIAHAQAAAAADGAVRRRGNDPGAMPDLDAIRNIRVEIGPDGMRRFVREIEEL